MITVLKKLALYEPVGQNLVILDNVNEGADGASAFFYAEETDEIKILDAQTIKTKLRVSFDITALRDSTAYNLISTWARTGVKVQATALGIDGAVVWRELTSIVKNQKLSTHDLISAKLMLDAVPGYGPVSQALIDNYKSGRTNSGVHAGKNLLMVYDREIGNTTQLSGYIRGGQGFITSQLNGVQTLIILPGQTSNILFQLNQNPNQNGNSTGVTGVLFPFIGEKLSFGLEVTSISGTWVFRVNFLRGNSTIINSNDFNMPSVGVLNLATLTVPEGTFFVDTQIRKAGETGTIQFRKPMMGIAPNATFTRF